MPEGSATADPIRDPRLDLFRGLALWVIFSDHIRGNPLAALTPARLGLSDMAEVFVAIAGFVSGKSVSRRLTSAGFVPTQIHALLRGAILLAAWALSAAALALLVEWTGGGPPRVQPLYTALPPPGSAEFWSRLVSGQLPVGPLNILLMYALFVTILPVVFVACQRKGEIVAALSVCAYLYVQFRATVGTSGVVSRTGWFFVPAAWQLLFFGAAVLVSDERPRRWLTQLPGLAGLALGTLIALVFWRSLQNENVTIWAAKGTLGPLRLLHFVALAMLLFRLLPDLSGVTSRCLCKVLLLCGRHSLALFCLGVLFAEAASRLTELVASPFARALACLGSVVAGCSVMVLLAYALEHRPARSPYSDFPSGSPAEDAPSPPEPRTAAAIASAKASISTD